jgi:hypothetical protein
MSVLLCVVATFREEEVSCSVETSGDFLQPHSLVDNETGPGCEQFDMVQELSKY